MQRFEAGLLEHVRTFFPDHAATLGAAQLDRVVRYGLQRAESRGIQTDRGVHLYLGLMFMLGSRFDEDPVLPWAALVKAPDAPATDVAPPETADACIETLYGQAMAFLDQTVGADNQLLRQTLKVWGQPQLFENLPPAPSVGHRLLLLLQTLSPEKYLALGEDLLRTLVRHGYETAKRRGLTADHGLMSYIALAFMLGSGFEQDPLYPWAAAVLNDPALVDPAQKGAALRTAALAFLTKCTPGCPQRATQSSAALARPAKPCRRIIEG